MPAEAEPGGREFTELTGEALDRAGEIYASIHFAPSDPRMDRTFGLHEDDQLHGLGRIQRHADGALEVGGFWIEESRRGAGLARPLVEHILSRLPTGRDAWCIPFEHLTDFYRSFGMQSANPDSAPDSIRVKLELCKRLHDEGHYEPVRLLRYPSPK